MPEVLFALDLKLNSMRDSIIEACQDVLTAREPYLACVTFLADTVNHEQQPTFLPTTFGVEVFISPGESKEVVVPTHRLVGHCTYFVSGHPNIVITSVVVRNDHQMANSEGVKFGRIYNSINPGEHLRITIAFRTAAT